MANIYWGDTFHKPDGNWNNPANWYLTLGNPGCSCGGGGLAANRVPRSGDSVVIVGGTALQTLTSLQGDVTTGPTLWAGPVSFYESPFNFPSNTFIRAGAYSGAVTVGAHTTYPTLFSGLPAFQFGVAGGTFTGSVILGKLNQSSASGGWQIPVITGGTYAPSAAFIPLGQTVSSRSGATPAVAYDLPASYVAQLPVDPGFAVGGGTFAPVITVTGVP